MRVSPFALADMRAAARAAHPREACGILLGEPGRILAMRAAANVHPDPDTRFEIDPQALIDAHRDARAGGPAVLGYFHSHPAGEAVPSAIDAAMAAHDGAIWAIIGPEQEQLRLWCDGRAGFTELSYAVTDD